MLPATLGRRARVAEPQSTVQHARLAVLALFALDGVIFGSWASRVPDVSDQVRAGSVSLGIALFCISLGALISMGLAGRLCERHGAGRVCAASAALLSGTVMLPGLSPSLPVLCVALLLFGLAAGAVNVAANSFGVSVQKRLDQPVMSLLHGGFSLGGLVGALLGGLLSGLLPVAVHLSLVGGIGLLLSAGITPALVLFDRCGTMPAPRRPVEPDAANRAGPDATGSPNRAALVVLGAIAGCTAFAEGALTDWGSLHLRENLHASTTVASAGYACFCLAMAAGRFTGRRWIARFGDTRLLVGGGTAAALGGLAAALGTSIPLVLAGFVLVGLGLANVFPLAIGRAGIAGGSRGVALASTVGYGGLLGGPPLIGFLAGAFGLPTALTSVAALAAVAAGLAVVAAAQLSGTSTVSEVLRARTRARLEPAARRLRVSAEQQGEDLLLLLG